MSRSVCEPGLTIIGYGWSLLSILAAGSACVGYYSPYWLIGGDVSSLNAEFGCFRLCYPIKSSTTGLISAHCGRFASFDDIPNVWWQVSTILVGVGCSLAVLVAFVSLPSWCVSDVISRASARVLGVHQLLAAILICVGCVLYPLGWDNNKWVNEACARNSIVGPYTLGSACGLFFCASLSAIAGRPIEWNRFMIHEEANFLISQARSIE